MLMSIEPSAMNRPTAKSSESPGRIGKSSPHSMKTMAALTQKNWLPKRSSSHWGSIQSGPREGVITRQGYAVGPPLPESSPVRTLRTLRSR